MRLLGLLSLVSVAVNLVLAVALLRPRGAADAVGAAAAPVSATSEPPASTDPSDAPLWPQLYSDERPGSLVARLRQAGFPPAVVRQVAVAIVAERFEAERAAVEGAALKTPYWRKWPESWLDPKIGPELRRLAREQEAMLKDLLGDEAAETEEQRAWAEQRYGRLDRDQRRRVQALEREYDERNLALISGAGKAFLPSDGDKFRANEREKQAKLAEFLAPEDVVEYQLRNGQAAASLKFLLGSLDVSEAEFRAMVPLYQHFQDQVPNAQPFGSASHLSTEQAAARSLAANALASEMDAAFGASRAEELKLALDPGFAQQATFARRLNLPLTVARDLHTIGAATARQAEELQADQSLTTEQRNARLQAVGREGLDRVAAVLGTEDAVRAYHLYTHNWFLNLGKPKR